MREIQIKGNPAPRPVSCMSYGQTRSGKTRWAGTWPRPLFLSDATEKGWETLAMQPDDTFYEPGRPPIVWAIETPADVHHAIDKAVPLIASGEVQTIVFDSLTFYSDLYLNKVTTEMAKSGKVDLRAAYGALSTHLGDLRIRIEKLGANVVWLALERTPEEGERCSVPMLAGKQAAKFSAGCSYIMFHRTSTVDKKRVYEMHTQPSDSFIAGGRDAGLLPDVIQNPTYREFADILGLVPAPPAAVQRPVVQSNPPSGNGRPVTAPAQRPVAPVTQRR